MIMNTINNLKEYQEDKENGISYFKRNVNKSKESGDMRYGAFNARRIYGDGVKAIIQAAEELKAPVMIQTTPSTVKYGTSRYLCSDRCSRSRESNLFRYAFTWTTAAAYELAMQAMHRQWLHICYDRRIQS